MKFLKHLRLFIFCLFFSVFYGQKPLNSIHDSIKKYYTIDFIKAKSFCKELEKKSEDSKDYSLRIINYCYLADISNALTQKDSVLYYYDKAMDIARSSGEIKNELIVKINKANYYNANFDFERALTIYDDCLKTAIQINDLYTVSHIHSQKANILYELEKYEESLNSYKKSASQIRLSKSDLLNNKMGIIKNYFKLNKIENVLPIIQESITIAKQEKNSNYEILFLKELSLYYRIKKDFAKSESIINQALNAALASKNISIITEMQLSKSELLTLMQRDNESITLLNQLLQENQNSLQLEHLCQVYYILSQNHNNLKQPNQSNEYLNLYIDNSKKIGQKKIDTIDHLHKIDITELQAREANLVNQKTILFGLVIVLFLIGIFSFLHKKRNDKINQERFEELLFKINEYEESHKNQPITTSIESTPIEMENAFLLEEKAHEILSETEASEDLEISEDFILEKEESDIALDVFKENEAPLKNEEQENNSFVIKDATVNEILEKLIKLEEKKLFLRQDFTLHNVAKRLKTNTAYLSKIINSELNKSFSTYANELRINYIIIELKNNAKLRSYSINAIAEEVGYKSPESFTKYFKLATGLSPSVYIKKINEINRN